jgi:biotin synthase-related radical SAM superfamily protein
MSGGDKEFYYMDKSQSHAHESPEYLRTSLAAALTLGFERGRFYRNARTFCVNVLLTYKEGCAARCAYCGLSHNRPGVYDKKSFIRVPWPVYPLDEIIQRISGRLDRVKRICISMITNRRSIQDTKDICIRLRSSFDVPVSLLISPTILNQQDLMDFKRAGADKIGVAIDLATPALFDTFRGEGVGGPHEWSTYWNCLRDSLEIFGKGNAGAHFIVGMGETEREMCSSIQRVTDMGGSTHLFSFFPEPGSQMADHPLPPMDQYRRIQVARFLIDNQITTINSFTFNDRGEITGFGLACIELDRVIDTGEPFRTSGCEGYDGQVACNRPFANSRPGDSMRNYPFPPEAEDIKRIRLQMGIHAPFSLTPIHKLEKTTYV